MKKIDLDKAPNPAKDYPPFPTWGETKSFLEGDFVSQMNRFASGLLVLLLLRGPRRTHGIFYYMRGERGWLLLLLPCLALIWWPRFFVRLLRGVPGLRERFADEDYAQWLLRVIGWMALMLGLWFFLQIAQDNMMRDSSL